MTYLASNPARTGHGARLVLPLARITLAVLLAAGPAPILRGQQGEPPVSPRDLYNAGTRQLRDGKLREAEMYLENALATQDERFATRVLYNLGHVRFQQGIEELKKSPAAGPTLQQARSTSTSADGAIRAAQESLNSGDIQRMLASYMRGRGTRRELRAALKAVNAALDAHGKTLNHWQRSSGDFHSGVELTPDFPDGRYNGQVVDRSIAKLIDSLQELQQMADALGEQNKDLREEMLKLRGKIPKPDMPPGAAGDDEEEEDEQPKQPEKGQKEAPTKPGEEMRSLSPDQAGWILDGFKLDSGRLPMGQQTPPPPRDRNKADW